MCGIVGVFLPHCGELVGMAERTLRRISHRGENELQNEIICETGWSLAANRLAITTKPGDPQPVWSLDGRVVLVLNGEVYNYASLSNARLSGLSQNLPDGDTYRVVELIAHEGRGVISAFDGMFAMIWV